MTAMYVWEFEQTMPVCNGAATSVPSNQTIVELEVSFFHHLKLKCSKYFTKLISTFKLCCCFTVYFLNWHSEEFDFHTEEILHTSLAKPSDNLGLDPGCVWQERRTADSDWNLDFAIQWKEGLRNS